MTAKAAAKPAAKKSVKPAAKRVHKPAAKPVAAKGKKLKGGGTFVINRHYHEIPVKGGGVMRAEAGDYIVKDAKGVVSVKPPSVFAIDHPEAV